MSGPIIRKYGFPNFEEIFGKEEMKHGVDEKEAESAKGESKEVKAEKKGAKKKGKKG